MKNSYLLLLILGFFIASCGESTPTQAPNTNNESPPKATALTESGAPATPAPTENPPTAQPVANPTINSNYTEDQKKIDEVVGNINENIGQYKKERTTVTYQEAEYVVVKYKDANGFVVKSEATGGERNWEFFAWPTSNSEDQLIYGTYYQKTADPYSPITRSIYHMGALTDLEPKSWLFIDQEGTTVEGEPLYKDEKDYQNALNQFMK